MNKCIAPVENVGGSPAHVRACVASAHEKLRCTSTVGAIDMRLQALRRRQVRDD